MTARNPGISVVANWLWLPLLFLVLLLFFLLQKIRDENHTTLAEAESLQREAIALRHAIRDIARSAPPTAAPANSAETQAPKSVGLKSYSDINVIADPDGGAAVVRRNRRYTMGNYRAAIDSLQLAPAEKERLKQLLAERWNARMDVIDLAQRRGESAPDKLVDAVVAEANQKIRGLLGDDGFAMLEAAYDEQSTKTSHWDLFTSAWDAGAPLTDDQQLLVARAMLQVKKQFSSREAADEIDPATGLTRSDLALIQLSASFLSPEQVAVIRADKTANAEYWKAVREAQQRKQSEGGRTP